MAQDLYERKLTTYPRTDARVLSTPVAKEIHKNISRLRGYEPTSDFVEQILDRKLYGNIAGTQYTDDAKVTDHYAIIPTGQLTELGKLNALQKSVFDLIVRRFLSVFYPAAEYQNVKMTAVVDVGKIRNVLCVRTCIKDTRLFGNCRNSKERGRRFGSEGTATSGRPAEKGR